MARNDGEYDDDGYVWQGNNYVPKIENGEELGITCNLGQREGWWGLKKQWVYVEHQSG